MLRVDGYEQVNFWYDRPTGLKAIMAIHSTELGPALGGLRFWPYKSEEDALVDVLRLAKGMTYKAAAAGLNLGGGKAVIIGDPKVDKSEALLRAFGRGVASLNGRYITAEDMGTNVWDMDYISLETKFVTGLTTAKGGSGDPSPMTAFGVFTGMRACCNQVWESSSIRGKRVAIQGTGHVGQHLARYIVREGGSVVATDVSTESLTALKNELGIDTVAPDDIYGVDCDIFAPCAIGAVINDNTIDQLKCKIIAGAANNQLAEERHGDLLHERGILYAPDYVINAGGLLNVYEELHGYNRERAMQKVGQLMEAMTRIVEKSKAENIPTYQAADHVAERRMQLIREVKRTYLNRN